MTCLYAEDKVEIKWSSFECLDPSIQNGQCLIEFNEISPPIWSQQDLYTSLIVLP